MVPWGVRHPFQAVRARYRRRRLRSLRALDPLREFAYIDDTSLYSLMASRVGALPAEYTDTRTAGWKRSGGLKLSFDSLPGNIEPTGTLERTTGTSSQVVRKSSLQAVFRDFYYREEELLETVPSFSSGRTRQAKRPTVARLEDLRSAAEIDNPWVIPVRRLRRGSLVEFRVVLSVDDVFRLTTVAESLSRIVGGAPSLFDVDSPGSFTEVDAIVGVFQKLMVDLIPLRSRIVDYGHFVDEDGERYLVHRDVQNGLSPLVLESVDLVGVVEPKLFWKDIRRCLFSAQEYAVFARIETPDIVDRWIPIKLAESLRDAVPTLNEDLTEGVQTVLLELSKHVQSQGPVVGDERREAALVKFVEELGLDATDPKVIEARVRVLESGRDWSDVTSRRADFAEAVADWDLGEVDISAARRRALESAGFDLAAGGFNAGPSTGISSLMTEDGAVPRLLEAEIVAIYW